MYIGMSLEQLVCAVQPVRQLPFPGSEQDSFPEAQSQRNSQEGNIPHMSIPKELWRLVDALFQGGAMQEKDIFSTTAEPGEVERIRECLDCGDDLPSCAASSVAECVVLFIASLPQPLIPTDLLPTQVSAHAGYAIGA